LPKAPYLRVCSSATPVPPPTPWTSKPCVCSNITHVRRAPVRVAFCVALCLSIRPSICVCMSFCLSHDLSGLDQPELPGEKAQRGSTFGSESHEQKHAHTQAHQTCKYAHTRETTCSEERDGRESASEEACMQACVCRFVFEEFTGRKKSNLPTGRSARKKGRQAGG